MSERGCKQAFKRIINIVEKLSGQNFASVRN